MANESTVKENTEGQKFYKDYGCENAARITILCTEEQKHYIEKCGCIAYSELVSECDCDYCGNCVYSADKINFNLVR